VGGRGGRGLHDRGDFEHRGEARLALEAVRESGLPVVVTLSLHRDGVSVVAYRLRGNDQIGWR
jgi:hypothetical protein